MLRLFFIFLLLNLSSLSFADSRKALECYYKQDNDCLEAELWKLAEANDGLPSQGFSDASAEKGFYIVGGIGASYFGNAHENLSEYGLNQIRGGRVLDTWHSSFEPKHDLGVSYSAAVGMTVMENIEIELGFLELGKTDFSENSELYFTDGSSFSGIDSLTLDLSGVAFSGIFSQRIKDLLDMYLRLGGVWTEQSRKYSSELINLDGVRVRGPREEYSENDFGLILGIGSSFDLSDRYALRVEVNRTDLPRGHLIQANTGVVFRF